MTENQEKPKKVSFPAFFLMWAEVQGWDVPDIHIAVCHFLQNRGRTAVLRIFRGCGKSTILAVYNAWAYYINPAYRILHQGDQDQTAFKTSRDTENVINRHPLTRGIQKHKGEVSFWFTRQGFNKDPRNPQMHAAGILSNTTSSRADEIQNDDVEVLKNVETEAAREKLRHRLSEQIHIAVPGAKKLFVGTPHTHNSLYDEMIDRGAEHLTIPLYGKEQRFGLDRTVEETRYQCKFIPEIVFSGIGKYAKILRKSKDYTMEGMTMVFKQPPKAVIDLYANCAWPERFDEEEMLERRKECDSLNYWDSQYQLHAKPITDVRLDPEKIIPYDVQPVIRMANRELVMMLGNVRIVGAAARWDCAIGKINGDNSSFSLVLTDGAGRLYWQVCEDLEGDIDQQCRRIRELVVQYQIPRVEVETNGPGGFVPPILRKHLKKTGCGVGEDHSSKNKNKRILDAFEPPISSGFLWAHVDVLNGPMWDEMLEWNPKVTDQKDDRLDSGAGAIAQTPVRIGKVVGISTENQRNNWRPNHGQFEVKVDHS